MPTYCSCGARADILIPKPMKHFSRHKRVPMCHKSGAPVLARNGKQVFMLDPPLPTIPHPAGFCIQHAREQGRFARANPLTFIALTTEGRDLMVSGVPNWPVANYQPEIS